MAVTMARTSGPNISLTPIPHRFGSALRSFWHTMTSNDRHASHDSPYRTGNHMPLNQSRHAPLTSIATSALESRPDLNSPYPNGDAGGSSSGLQNGNTVVYPASPNLGPLRSPTTPYSPGMRSSLALQRKGSTDQPFDSVTAGEIQLQSFQEGLPPAPPVTHSWKRIDRWTEENYPELYDQLCEGCTQNDVNELEHELDCSLPMDIRESLQYHDGQERGGRPTGIIFGCMLLDCEEIVQEWKNWRVVNEEYLTPPAQRRSSQAPIKPFAGPSSSTQLTLQPSVNNSLWRQQLLDRQDSQPSRAIQKAYAHPGWIPLARDWGGNNIAVDLAPGPLGKWGQIVIFGRDYDCKYVIARSWAAFLATVADDLSSEKVFVDEETQELKLREFKTAGVEPGYLDILRWRADQKYGRKAVRRRPSSGLNLNTYGQPSSNGSSPYASPTEERGRSPMRFSHRASSPRGNVARPSPLGQVSEEHIAPKPIRPIKSTLSTEIPLPKTNGKLVEVDTPITSNGQIQESLDKAVQDQRAAAADANDKGSKGNVDLNGLGVHGIDGLKTVDI